MSKRNMRRILSLLLVMAMVLSLVATTVAAKVYTDDVYTDVMPEDWFYENVKSAYERELMIGKGNKRFAPTDYVTVAETVAIAARLHSNGANFEQGDPWYQVYADYVEENGIADLSGLEMNVPATREQFVTILANALPETAFEEINFVAEGAIPDVPMSADYAKAVYKLYRAGILIGNDAKGTFAPDSKILRREVAAIITRMVDKTLRLTVELGEKEPEPVIDDPIPEDTEYTVKFMLYFPGGGTYLKKTVDAGKTVTEPMNPKRAGYTFDGWYLENDEYDFNAPVTGDLELRAHWKANERRPVVMDNRTVKAVLSENGTQEFFDDGGESIGTHAVYKLSFYYDDADHSGEGTIYTEGYGVPTGFVLEYDEEDNLISDDWGWSENRAYITSVEIDPGMADYYMFTSMAYMFAYMTNARDIIGAEYLNTANVTNMSHMFYRFGVNVADFNAIPDVSNWDTSKVENMHCMFNAYGRYSTELDKVPDVSNWDTSKVTDMAYMFGVYGRNSTAIELVPDVSGWKTGNVTDMNHMFQSYGYSSQQLTAVPDVSGWNTGNVTNMSYMFSYYGRNSTMLNAVPNVSGWQTGNVTNMYSMFDYYGYSSTVLVFTLDLSNWDVSAITNKNGNTIEDYMFWCCASTNISQRSITPPSNW